MAEENTAGQNPGGQASPPAPEWRGSFTNEEVNALHAECFSHRLFQDDWWTQVNRYSLGWVCLRIDEKLVGFVNIAWDGGVHAFLLDTMVANAFRGRGLATLIVKTAVDHAKTSGCEWLHVDFEPHLKKFYFDSCGFRATDAGLIPLR